MERKIEVRVFGKPSEQDIEFLADILAERIRKKGLIKKVGEGEKVRPTLEAGRVKVV